MKYTLLGLQQKKLMKFGLDYIDAILLRYFVDFKDTKKMKALIINGEPYYWVKYDAVIEEYPIIGIKNNDAIYRRYKKMANENILKHKTVKRDGTYSFYALGERYLELISDSEESEGSVLETEGYGFKNGTGTVLETEGYGFKNGTNNPSTIYPSTIYNPIYCRVVDYLNKKTNKNYRSTTKNTQKVIKARIDEGFKEEEFYKVIDNKVQTWTGTEYEKYLTPETLFGNKFDKYLNEKVIIPTTPTEPTKRYSDFDFEGDLL